MVIDQEFFEYGIIPVIVLLHSKRITNNIDFNSQEPEFSIMSVRTQIPIMLIHVDRSGYIF